MMAASSGSEAKLKVEYTADEAFFLERLRLRCRTIELCASMIFGRVTGDRGSSGQALELKLTNKRWVFTSQPWTLHLSTILMSTVTERWLKKL